MTWPLLIFLFPTFVLISGQESYNGCYDEKWIYHGHSHTCIRHFAYAATWADASVFCKGQVSSGHLLKIDDEITDTFITELVVPKYHWQWIGLYALANGTYRWDGFPNEVPQYIGTIKNDDGYTTKGFFIVRGFWGRSDRDWKNFICQHDPFIPQTQIKCTPPTRENTNSATPIECQYYFNHWNSLTMTGPDGRASTCTNGQTCVGQLDGLTITESKGQNGHFLAQYNGQMTRHQEGNWSCSINLPSKRIGPDKFFWTDLNLRDSKSCQLQIYEPASPLSCKQTLLPNSLTVVCSTDRIYPQASCLWKYSQNSIVFRTLDAKLSTDTHTSYTDDQNGFTYFRSECQLKLTNDDFTFTPGALVVQVAMIPSIDGVDMSSNLDAIRTADHRVVIDTPSKPVLLLSGKSILNDAVLFIWTDEEISLTCQVSSYSPPVQTTVLLCEFPITQSGVDVSKMSVDGSSVGMTQTATRLMDGKKCTCWGEHITGRSEIGTVTFNIAVPAKIKGFYSNASTVVEQASQVSMSCEVSGVPSPSLTISKYPPLIGEEIAVIKPTAKATTSTSTTTTTVRHQFQARCSDNGQYICKVTNTLFDQLKTGQDSSELRFRVKCPPTRCEGEVPRAFAKSGGNSTVTLCAFSYPLPDFSKFQLQMRNGDQAWDKVNANFMPAGDYFDFMSAITVTIQHAQSYQFGTYRLYYPTDDGTTSQHISFHLDRLDDEDSSSTSTTPVIVAVVISVVVVVVSIVVVVVVMLYMRRKRCQTKQGTQADAPDNTPASYESWDHSDIGQPGPATVDTKTATQKKNEDETFYDLPRNTYENEDNVVYYNN